METFWRTIGLYNSSTGAFQLLIILAGLIITVLLAMRPGRRTTVAMKAFLVILYLWTAIVYFLVCCAERSYNYVMTIFWLVMAAAWIWDMATGYTEFRYNRKHSRLAFLLLMMPFMYPIASIARGMSFPEIVSPIMPCSVVVFTIGVMLMFSRRINLFIVLLLCHWSIVALSKTYFFNIPEDYLLICASIPAVYLFFKEYFLSNINGVTKPQAKFMEWFLRAICIGVCIVLAATMLIELFRGI